MVTGVTQNFWQMFFCRMVTGIGETGILSSGSSIISDFFPAKKRSAAIAISVSGATVGLTVGLMFGGYIAERYGWRYAFIIVGLAGAPVALLTGMVLQEPQRGIADKRLVSEHQERFIDLCKTLLRNRTYVQILLAACLLNFMLFGVIQWMPALIIIGMLSDQLRPSMENAGALEAALSSIAVVTSIWALIHLYLSLRNVFPGFHS